MASRADEMFADLVGRNRGRSGRLSGKLVITAFSGVAALITPALRAFHIEHPQVELEFRATTDLVRLKRGESHVAFRAGPKPETLDHVVRLLRHFRFGLYASRDNVHRRGRVEIGKLDGHSFVGKMDETSRLPFVRWTRDTLGPGPKGVETPGMAAECHRTRKVQSALRSQERGSLVLLELARPAAGPVAIKPTLEQRPVVPLLCRRGGKVGVHVAGEFERRKIVPLGKEGWEEVLEDADFDYIVALPGGEDLGAENPW